MKKTPEQQIIDIVYSIRSDYYKRLLSRYDEVFRKHRDNMEKLEKENPEFTEFLITFFKDFDDVYKDLAYAVQKITEDVMVGIVSTIMTILILVASEIIPKTIGATYWEDLAVFTATALNLLIFPLKYSGILWLLQLTTRLIGGDSHSSILSRESFLVMADMAEKEGVFHQNESKVIRNLIGFKEIKVTDVMTPRSVLEIADENDTIASFYEEHQNLRFSRIPLFNENPDEKTGYFLKNSLLEAIMAGKGEETLSTLKREILITDRDLSIPDLFDILIKEKEHIALVVDEYGSVNGIVSQEDVIETLLGLEIMDETDNVADLQELARKSWKDRAKNITFKRKNPS
jgi:CBS domain containing-hemolysin-like protein